MKRGHYSHRFTQMTQIDLEDINLHYDFYLCDLCGSVTNYRDIQPGG